MPYHTCKILVILILQTFSFALEVQWFGHSAFLIRSKKGTTVLLDPWISNPANPFSAKFLADPGKIDYILISHGHGDSLGDTETLLKTTKARVITSWSLLNQLQKILGWPPEHLFFDLTGSPGGQIRLEPDLNIHFIKAIHSSEVMGKDEVLHYGGDALGFLIAFDQEPTVYFTGDTDLFLDMKLIPAISPVHLMLACIDGRYTMGPAKAALATKFVDPEVVIPMKYGTLSLMNGTPLQFQQEIAKTSFRGQVLVPSVGEKIKLEKPLSKAPGSFQ